MSGLKRTDLYDLHLELGARMVPFAGYEMPVQYPMGVLKEHLHTRAEAGLFDVGHMGQVLVPASAAGALEALVPVSVAGLQPGRQRYGFFTNEAGGIRDDLMIAHLGEMLLLVVNAACKEADFALIAAAIPEARMLADRALLALQGPGAEAALARLLPGVAKMGFMEIDTFQKPEKTFFSEIFLDSSLGYLFKWIPIRYNISTNLTNNARCRHENKRYAEAICHLFPQI